MFGAAEPRLPVPDGRGRRVGRAAAEAIAGVIARCGAPRAADLARLGAGAPQWAPSAGSGQI